MRMPGAPIFGGMNVMVDVNWPRDHVADAVYSYLPHRFWLWMWRTILRREFPPSMERGHKIMQDRDPVIYLGRDIICSPRQFEELKRAIAAQ